MTGQRSQWRPSSPSTPPTYAASSTLSSRRAYDRSWQTLRLACRNFSCHCRHCASLQQKANTRALWLCPTAFLQVSNAIALSLHRPPLRLHCKGVYELEVVLEFGRLRGAAQGNICSSDRPYCEPEEANARVLLDTHGVAMGYVGAVIDRQPLHVEEGRPHRLKRSASCLTYALCQEGRPSESQTPRSAVICRACRDFGTRIASSAGMRAARAVYKRRGRRCQR